MENTSNKKIRFGIIGAGNGGRAFTVYLKKKGYSVKLGFRTYKNIRKIFLTQKIESHGVIKGIFSIDLVTDDYSEVVSDVDIILFVLPANVHKEVAVKIAPYLKNGQIILLNPGRTWGAIEVYNVIKQLRPKLRIYVAETQTLLFTSRGIKDYGVNIMKIKNNVKFCFYPEYFNLYKAPPLLEAFPSLELVDDIRITSLNNIGSIVHPTTIILNAGSIARNEPFKFYLEGTIKPIVNLIEEVDYERLQIMETLGLEPYSFLDWVRDVYGINAKTYREAFLRISSYKNVKSPSELRMRYLTEDVPTGLVPLASLGRYLGIPTPAINSVIKLAETILSVDFKRIGRTISNVGVPIKLLTPNNLQETLPKDIEIA
ncbi:MAG: NAD/NADP octopine/nopaline dehydrogenase family protein [Promethearchaeota archaeon]